MNLKKIKSKLPERIKNSKGFTLVEMIVVLAIIAILVALIAPNVARLIKSAQQTSETAKAKTVMNAAQSYATDAVGNGAAITGTPQGAGANAYLLLDITGDNGNDAMQGMYQMPTGAAGALANNTEDFMAAGGNAYLAPSVLAGQEHVYLYVSTEGAIMGSIYTNDNIIKSVAGVAPTGAVGATPPAFTTKSYRGGTIVPGTGVITVPAP